MDGPRHVIMSEVREGNISHDIPYIWNLQRNDKSKLKN